MSQTEWSYVWESIKFIVTVIFVPVIIPLFAWVGKGLRSFTKAVGSLRESVDKINTTLAVHNNKHESITRELNEIKDRQDKRDEEMDEIRDKLNDYRNECAVRHQYSARPKGRF